MSSNLLAVITVPKFITKVKTANKARKKYYSKKSKKTWNYKAGDLNGKYSPIKKDYKGPPYKLPAPKTKLLKVYDGDYSWKGRYLVDGDGKRLIANPRQAGEPRYEILSGNKLLSGYGSHHVRAMLVGELKKFYRPHVQKYTQKHGPIEKFPIRVSWDIHTTVENKDQWDASNLFFYYKYFEDCLHETTDEDKNKPLYKGKELQPLIPDDNIKYVTWSPGSKIIPVDEWEERKFVFRFYRDKRKVLDREPWVQSSSSNSE